MKSESGGKKKGVKGKNELPPPSLKLTARRAFGAPRNVSAQASLRSAFASFTARSRGGQTLTAGEIFAN